MWETLFFSCSWLSPWNEVAPFFSFLSNLLPPNPATWQIKSLGSLPDLVTSRTSVFYIFLCFIFLFYFCFIFCFSVFLFLFCFCLFVPVLSFVQQLHLISFYCSCSLVSFTCFSVCFNCVFSWFCVVFSVFLACLLLSLFLVFLSCSFMFATSSTMEDDYRVVDWPEFEPKNKMWKGALEINELKGESTIEFMLWWKEMLIWLSTQNLIHHLFLDKVPTGEPVLIKFEEEMEEITEKIGEAEKKRILAERKELEVRHKEKLEYKQQINQRCFDDCMDNQMNLTNLLNKTCVGRAKGYLSDLKRRTPKLIWDTLILNLSTVIVHNVKEVKSKLEDCCIRENETISSFELRLKELFLHVEALKGKPIPMNKKLGYIWDSHVCNNIGKPFKDCLEWESGLLNLLSWN